MTVRKIKVTGVVQGVGFRPFVYKIATRANLKGWVANTSAGVEIELEGDAPALDSFLRSLREDKPPLAQIDSVRVEDAASNGHPQYDRFEIRASVALEGAFQPISPDISICPDCLHELFDPSDRRYRYPFINCTNCGPRFTIIEDIPYDRPKTTMRAFELCKDCAREYADPLDRRFHAQPVACPKCGPQVWLQVPHARRRDTPAAPTASGNEAIAATQRMLSAGGIVAIKGLGGFHLACDATNSIAVAELRWRKLRVDKPFALMMPDLAAVERQCFVGDAERALLESRERPIVLLRRRDDSEIAEGVAPGNRYLGVMLPYTPLHYLLLTREERTANSGLATVLVMTSGNLSEEPIATDNDDARERLAKLADGFLMHNRDIRTRCDDSVVRVFESAALPASESVYPVRRSRGYAPFPVRLPFDAPPLLATGAELKNTFCITRDRYAFLSHHVGDLENYETLRSFEDGAAAFERLFRVEPKVIAYDLHPDYLATRYALERAERQGIRSVGVQHHHAHIAACMAEHGLSGERPVIGVAFDGTGYGDDGAIWGGEILIADYAGYRRMFHLDYVPLPGGDKAVREPWRIALAWLHKANVAWSEGLEPVHAAGAAGASGGAGGAGAAGASDAPGKASAALHVVRQQIERGVNAPMTSSMGRLFDAAAALAGVRQTVNYEAQAAIEFEMRVDPAEQGEYTFEIREAAGAAKSTDGGSRPNPPAPFPAGKGESAPLSFRRGAGGEVGDRLGNSPAVSSDSIGRIVDPAPAIRALVADVQAGVPCGIVSARFHNGVAAMVARACGTARDETGLNEVALSGGVWQNMTLLAHTVERLRADGFSVYVHRLVPANDGGLALGQAVVAAWKSTGQLVI